MRADPDSAVRKAYESVAPAAQALAGVSYAPASSPAPALEMTPLACRPRQAAAPHAVLSGRVPPVPREHDCRCAQSAPPAVVAGRLHYLSCSPRVDGVPAGTGARRRQPAAGLLPNLGPRGARRRDERGGDERLGRDHRAGGDSLGQDRRRSGPVGAPASTSGPPGPASGPGTSRGRQQCGTCLVHTDGLPVVTYQSLTYVGPAAPYSPAQ
jgi:hypothetical protein